MCDDVAFRHAKALEEYPTATVVELLFAPAYATWVHQVKVVFSVIERHIHARRSTDKSFACVALFFDKPLSSITSPQIRCCFSVLEQEGAQRRASFRRHARDGHHKAMLCGE
jgi:hypothetical protein